MQPHKSRFAPRSLLAVALILAAGVRVAAVSSAEQWLNHYYQNPNPEQLSTAVSQLSRSGYFEQKGHIPLAIGFFASVFAQHPDRVTEWLADSRMLPTAHQRLLVSALWYSGHPLGGEVLRAHAAHCSADVQADIARLLRTSPSLAQAAVLSPSSLNLQWGVFLATGDRAPVQAILAALGSNGDSALGQDLRWSLAQKAVAHDRVLAICRDELARQPNTARESLRAVIRDAELKPAQPAS